MPSSLDLPTDFLSTPFGAALRPTIDSMFRRPTAGGVPSTAPPPVSNPDLASALLQGVASRATSNSTPSYLPTSAPTSSSAPTPTPATQTLASPIHLSTNPSSFHSVLRTHRALVAFFTSTTCGPCRIIAPVFEELAAAKSRNGVAFTKIDLAVGMGSSVASEWGVRVTPTFVFFLDGKKVCVCDATNLLFLNTKSSSTGS
jgi:thiol-disulfide isomerase/thioredoxin